MLEIKAPAKLELKLMGVKYELLKPSRKKVMALQEQLRTDEGKEQSLSIMGDFLVESGLPKEVADDLQVEHIGLIVEHLLGAKKN